MRKITFEENLKNRVDFYGISEAEAVCGFLNDYDRGLISYELSHHEVYEVFEDGSEESYFMEADELFRFWNYE